MAGKSLAALFALYALCQTAGFKAHGTDQPHPGPFWHIYTAALSIPAKSMSMAVSFLSVQKTGLHLSCDELNIIQILQFSYCISKKNSEYYK